MIKLIDDEPRELAPFLRKTFGGFKNNVYLCGRILTSDVWNQKLGIE